jgi:hypothetical protein
MSRPSTISDSGDPLEALLGAMTQPNHQQQGTGTGSTARIAPITLGWTLEMPLGSATELNIVRLYKTQRFVVHQDQQTQGWSACSTINKLKTEISNNPSGCTVALLLQYMGALALVREHVGTNDHPYLYNGGRVSSTAIDFELYMMLATLAARDTSDATGARRLQTDQSYIMAYDRYMHAADVLHEALRELCQVLPPSDRVHYGAANTMEWLTLVGPGQGASLAKIIALMGARVHLIRCEAYVSAYRAIELIVAEDQSMGDTLDGAAVFVSQKFAHVVNTIARARKPDESRTLMELYASFMACLFRLMSVARQATADLVLAENELSTVYLARTLRRLERTSFPVTTREEWQIVDADTTFLMQTALRTLDAIRARAETLRSQDTTGAFSIMDMNNDSSVPLPIEAIDPSFAVVHEDAMPVRPFSLRTLRERAAQLLPDLVSFLELRIDQKRAMEAIHNNPALSSLPSAHEHGRNVSDGILAMFASQVTQRSTDTQWCSRVQPRIGQADAMLDIMFACFALGRLGERLAWVQFMFSTEDYVAPDAPPSETTLELENINVELLKAAKYFVDLGHALDLKPI